MFLDANMAAKEPVYIFHLFRRDGKALILNPFASPEKLLAHLEQGNVQGRYGKEPRVESLTLFRNELYRMIEAAVKNWVSDMRFIPKFLISTAVFLVGYFVLSYVIRDPIPVIDEIAVALGAAIIIYILLGRRDMSSDRAMKKRVALRTIVDRIQFRESDFVKRVEQTLYKNESEEIERVVRSIVTPEQQQLGSPDRQELSQFLRLLENQFNFRRLKREEKVLKRYVEDSQTGHGSSSLRKWAASKNLDFPLYAVYKCFKQTVTNSK